MIISRAFLRKNIDIAFRTAGSLKRKIDFTRQGEVAYDPVTGTSTSTDTVVAGIEVLFPDVKNTDLNPAWGVNEKTDSQVLIRYKDLPFKLAADDWFTLDGVKWQIVYACEPFGEALHTIYAREA